MFTDGRYTIQSKIESGKNFKIYGFEKLINCSLFKNLTLGIDPKLFTNTQIKNYFLKYNKIKHVEKNLIDEIKKQKKNQKPYFTDSFGHEYYDGPARYLATLVSQEMNLRCRYEKPGTIQRSLIDSISDVDAQEAHIAGEKAVEAAIRGDTNVIITLNRASAERYECVTGTTPLSRVANLTRKLPKEFLPLDGGHAKPDFINYLAPLTGKKLPFTTTIQ